VKIEAKEKVRTYIVTTWLSDDDRGFADDSDLHEAGLLDSLTTIALVSFLEESFAIRLDPADINPETFRTVDSIAQLVAHKRIA
jgi:acyl carrier protein